MLAIFLCGFATTNILTEFPICWRIKKQKALTISKAPTKRDRNQRIKILEETFTLL